MTAAETISQNWCVSDQYEILLTQDQLDLLGVGNVTHDGYDSNGESNTTFIFPMIIKKIEGKFYVTGVIRLDKSVTHEDSIEMFSHPEKIRYTIEK